MHGWPAAQALHDFRYRPVTIPRAVRDALALYAGDRIDFLVVDVMSRMRPDYAAQFSPMCLCGITLKPYSYGRTVDGHGVVIRDSKQDHKDGRRNRVVPLAKTPVL